MQPNRQHEERNLTRVYKIFREAEWRSALESGVFMGSLDDLRDGYIHLSAGGQIAATAAKYFRGQRGLVLAAFDAAVLAPALKWEPARGWELFPHLYGPLDVDLALATWRLTLDPDDAPRIPPEAV